MSSELYRVGAIVGIFGVKGELKLDPTDAGAALYVCGAKFRARPQEQEIELASVRAHKGRFLVQLVQAPTSVLAEAYVGAELFVARESVVALLAEDEILDVDLIGMAVFDSNERALGEVVDVEHYPSSAMLVVGPARVFIPFVKAYIVSFDRQAKRMILNLPEGLFDS